MTLNTFGTCGVCAASEKIVSPSRCRWRALTALCRISSGQLFIDDASTLTAVQRDRHECRLSGPCSLNCLVKTLFIDQWSLHGNMQTNSHDQEQNDGKDEAPHNQPHVYTCDCHDCQIKYGSLPLLVQVIEGQEKSELGLSTATASFSGDTDSSTQEGISDQNINYSEPSTSSAVTSPSHKKIMKCPHCSKSFTHRGDMNKHVRKHTGEQPYTCHICDRKFAHTSNLNRHLRVHSGDRPFVCDSCNKNFNRKDKLDMHKKTKLCKKFSQR